MNRPLPDNESDAATPPCTRAQAEAGDAAAQFGLAFWFVAAQNYEQAITWYFKAADQNHRLAQFNLGQMFAKGQGTDRNDSTAAMWIQRAANGGDAGAQFDLGNRCGRSSFAGAEQDAAESRIESYKWFKLAAIQGYRNAQDRTDSAALHMSQAEVMEGNRRIAEFVMS